MASPDDVQRRRFLARAPLVLPFAGLSAGVARAEAASVRGLDFPGSAGVERTMRFRFLNPLPIYPATYLWWARPRRQAGYYTAFFWGNDDGQGDLRTFLWTPSGD